MLRFLLHHPLLNTPALSPALCSPHPHRWHQSLPTSTDTHPHLHPPLQSCSREEIYCRPRLLWANTNKMLFCCNLFNWPRKRRLEHVQALPAPAWFTHAICSLCLAAPGCDHWGRDVGEKGDRGRGEAKGGLWTGEGRKEPTSSGSSNTFPSPFALPQAPEILISQAA